MTFVTKAGTMSLFAPLLFFINLGLIDACHQIELIYKTERPTDKSELVFIKKAGEDYFDRAEKILKDVEKEVIALAESRNVSSVEIYVLEQQHGEIPTESQIGKVGYVSVFVSLKNHNKK